jgi:DNA-binding NarL/FixJ family response regulator
MTNALINAGLTDREAQIIHQLAHGRSKRDIASTLNISQRTVAKHLERCFRKLDVNTQSTAATKAWTLTD